MSTKAGQTQTHLYVYLATSTASKMRVLEAVFERIGLKGDDLYFEIRPESEDE